MLTKRETSLTFCGYLSSRRFEPSRNRLNFGETIAIMVVVVSIVLLGWEMLNLFKIFPIKLQRHD